MSELKPCPFCGASFFYRGQYGFVACEECCAEGPYDDVSWNTRPGEDAAWNAALEAAVEVCGCETAKGLEIATAIRAMKKWEG